MDFSAEYFTEMWLSYIFRPSVVNYDVLRNNRYSRLHAVIDCLFFCTWYTFKGLKDTFLLKFPLKVRSVGVSL